jgi:hypothetical protein
MRRPGANQTLAGQFPHIRSGSCSDLVAVTVLADHEPVAVGDRRSMLVRGAGISESVHCSPCTCPESRSPCPLGWDRDG